MAGSIDRRRGYRAEINVTPLVDVVLVLLIIFMVITPLITRGKAVQLPAAASARPTAESSQPLALTITADKRLWLDARPIAEPDLALALSARKGRALLIRADRSLSMRDLRPLLRRLKSSGLEQIAFGVAPSPSSQAVP